MKASAIVCVCGLLASSALGVHGRETRIARSAPERREGNVVHSDKPLQGVRMIELEERLKIDSQALGKDVYFGINDYALSPSGEAVYLLDAKDFKICVFDVAGKIIRAIQIRKGQGPGEFEGAFSDFNRAYPRKEGLWVEDYGKIALLDDQGTLIKERQKGAGCYQIQGLSPERLLVVREERTADKIVNPRAAFPVTQYLQLEDWEGQTLARYFSSDKSGGWGNGWINHVRDVRITPLIVFDFYAPEQKLVYALSDEYSLYVKDLSGKVLQTIRRDFLPQKITGKLRGEIMASPNFQKLVTMFRQMGEDFAGMMDLNQTWDHLNPILGLQFLANGMICVFVIKDAQERFDADIFDRQGRWLTTLQFPVTIQKLRNPRIQGNRLMGLAEDGDEESFYVEYSMKNATAELLRQVSAGMNRGRRSRDRR